MGLFSGIKKRMQKLDPNVTEDILESFFDNFYQISKENYNKWFQGFKYSSKITLFKIGDSEMNPLLKSENEVGVSGMGFSWNKVNGSTKAITKDGTITATVKNGIIEVGFNNSPCGQVDYNNKKITTSEGKQYLLDRPDVQLRRVSGSFLGVKLMDRVVGIKSGESFISTINIKSASQELFTSQNKNLTRIEMAIITAIYLFESTIYLGTSSPKDVFG